MHTSMQRFRCRGSPSTSGLPRSTAAGSKAGPVVRVAAARPGKHGGTKQQVATPDASSGVAQQQQQPAPATRLLQQAGHLAVATAMAASLLLSPAAVAEEGGTLLRLPASENPDVYAAQQTLMEAWSLVGETFVDEDFNGHWWPDELKAHMMAAYRSSSGGAAYEEISAMLSELGDPYTRIIPPAEYADFRVSSEGELQGVGLLISNEPVNNHLLVLSTIKGSPAERAGITSGDEVIAINDQPTDGWTGDMAAKLLRGKGGTEVRLKFARRTAGIPGVPGRPEPRRDTTGPLPFYADENATVREVRLRRERVALSPVYYTALQAESPAPHARGRFSVASAPALADEPSSQAGGQAGGPLASLATAYGSILDTYSSTAPGRRPLNSAPTLQPPPGATAAAAVAAAPQQRQPGAAVAAANAAPERWGYLRLTSFSQNAADEMRRAIVSLERKGVSGYILDLRDNPGGLVRAGVDIARLLMDGHPTVFSIVSRGDEPEQKVVLGEDDFSTTPDEALTHKPLTVLVNAHSASASEILSGALHDNGRATVIGDTPTYGKGRIQSVYELHDGSALFVTVAKYVTPAGTPIDLKGLKPDTSCSLGGPLGGGGGGLDDGAEGPDVAGLLAMAASFVPGMQVGPGAEEALASALSSDPCVLKAATLLHDEASMVRATAQVAASLPLQS